MDMDNLKALRKRRKLTQAQLAARVGCTQGTVSRIEAGDLNVSLSLLKQIADALQVEPYELFGLSALQLRALDALRSLPADRQAAALMVLESLSERQ